MIWLLAAQILLMGIEMIALVNRIRVLHKFQAGQFDSAIYSANRAVR